MAPRRVLVVLAAAALAVPLAPAAARAEAVTWTVQPAGPGGPDGRRWIERTLDPGQRVTEHLAVRNFGKAEAVFALKAADGYLTDKGRFTMLASAEKSKDGGTWITVPATVTVPAGGTRVVPFTVTAPRTATPGDHPAGIAATVLSRSGAVQVESRVGFRVLLRAGGDLRPSLAAAQLKVTYTHSWNPLRSGTAHVTYLTTNTGNVRVEARAHLKAGTRTRDLDGRELLPGDARPAAATVGGVWPLFRLRTTVTLTPVVLGGPGRGAPTTVTVTTWTMPWPQLLAVLALTVLAAVARYRRRRFRRLLAEARARAA